MTGTLGYALPFGVPQVGILKDVKSLPWTYSDFNRWTTLDNRTWALDTLREWLPAHPLALMWRVEEASHINGGILPLTDPILRLFIYSRANGWCESGSQFTEHTRGDQAAFVAQITLMLDGLAEAAGV